jgi:DNA-binding NtrC family response regulator
MRDRIAPRGTHMSFPTTGISVLIVDRSGDWGADLSERLLSTGVEVHVVPSQAAAMRLALGKRISVAVLEYAMDQWTQDLAESLAGSHVPVIYTASTHHGGAPLRSPAAARGAISLGAAL